MVRNKIKKIITVGSSAISALLVPFVAMAEQVELKSPIKPTNFLEFFTAIAKGVAAIIGPAAGLMVVVAGVLFVTSGGSPERVKTAKTCLFYAIIGGLIAGSAEIIARTVGSLF